MKKKIKNKCIDCRKQISPNAERCISCFAKSRHIEKNKCIDCRKEVQRKTKRCRSCYSVYAHGKNSSHWKGGQKYSKCIDCGKNVVNYHAKRCKSCASKYYSGEKHQNWKDGKHKCIDCKKELNSWNAKRCVSCSSKYFSGKNSATYKNGKPKCIDCRKELNYYSTKKKKRCLACYEKSCHIKKNKCIDCGKEIQINSKRCHSCASIYYTTHHNAGWKERPTCIDCGKELAHASHRRCNSCARKYLWTLRDFQKKQALAQNRKPNTKEIILNKILNKNYPNEYKYVGDFQFWLGGKNPDFMNMNSQKKLIEFYGNYWHKDENPKGRIRHFKKYGFDTLVIWERELKNISRLERKLNRFHNLNKTKS